MKKLFLALLLGLFFASNAFATVTILSFQAKSFGSVTICQMIVQSDEGIDLAQCLLPNGDVLNPSSSSQNGNFFSYSFTESGNGGIFDGSSVNGVALGSQGGGDVKAVACHNFSSFVYCH